jgi:hypothetical protein
VTVAALPNWAWRGLIAGARLLARPNDHAKRMLELRRRQRNKYSGRSIINSLLDN